MTDNIDDLNKKYEKLSKDIEKMQLENMELFQAFGTTPEELLRLLSDKQKMPKALYELLEKQRRHLEDVLARRIDAAQAAIKKKENIFDVRPGGHWIFVR